MQTTEHQQILPRYISNKSDLNSSNVKIMCNSSPWIDPVSEDNNKKLI